MKFIVSSQQLSKNLQAVSGVLTSSTTMPILQNFLFTIKEEGLTVTATDLETTMSAIIPLSKVEGEGIIAVPSKILMETLKTLPDVPTIFNIDEESLSIEIVANEGVYSLVGLSGDDFPKLPIIEESTSIELKSSLLKTAISKTMFASGTDEMRMAMTGVFCELSPENITFVATDAHKLVRYRRTDASSENTASFILSKKPLSQLKNTLSDEDLLVKIEYNKTNVHFSFNNINLIARLIDGKYPNYEAVIPLNNPNILIVERVSFLNAMKRVSIFANQSTMQVRMKIDKTTLVLTAEDVEYSNQAIEKLPCNYEGEDLDIGFNSKFLQEMLNNVDSNEIRMEMSQPNRAGIIYPVNNSKPEEEILMLVMPVMLNQ